MSKAKPKGVSSWRLVCLSYFIDLSAAATSHWNITQDALHKLSLRSLHTSDFAAGDNPAPKHQPQLLFAMGEGLDCHNLRILPINMSTSGHGLSNSGRIPLDSERLGDIHLSDVAISFIIFIIKSPLLR